MAMTPNAIINHVRQQLEGQYQIKVISARKIFAIRANSARADVSAKINAMIDVVNELTVEDQLNGKGARRVSYAFLSEQGEQCAGFSFEVQ